MKSLFVGKIIILFASIIGVMQANSVLAQTPEPPMFSHYMPGELNEAAIFFVSKGDYATAKILLERANLLNPNSPDIQENLQVVNVLLATDSNVVVQIEPPKSQGKSANKLEDLTLIPNLWPLQNNPKK